MFHPAYSTFILTIHFLLYLSSSTFDLVPPALASTVCLFHLHFNSPSPYFLLHHPSSTSYLVPPTLASTSCLFNPPVRCLSPAVPLAHPSTVFHLSLRRVFHISLHSAPPFQFLRFYPSSSTLPSCTPLPLPHLPFLRLQPSSTCLTFNISTHPPSFHICLLHLHRFRVLPLFHLTALPLFTLFHLPFHLCTFQLLLHSSTSDCSSTIHSFPLTLPPLLLHSSSCVNFKLLFLLVTPLVSTCVALPCSNSTSPLHAPPLHSLPLAPF